MIKKPFFGWGRPRLKYSVIKGDDKEAVTEIPLPLRASIIVDCPMEKIDERFIKRGDQVKAGKKIVLSEEDNEYFISPVTGTVANISEHTGYMGMIYSSILIEDVVEDQWDDSFKNTSDRTSIKNILAFLRCLPGGRDLAGIINSARPINVLVVKGIDEDLLVETNQSCVINDPESLAKGIAYLKEITNAEKIIIIVPQKLVPFAEKSGAEVQVIKPFYPNAMPKIVMKDILKIIGPPGSSCEDMGVAFINAEAVVALADALEKGDIPVNKTVTLIDKGGSAMNIKVRIGTHVKDILEHLNITTKHGDRLVMGGPMRGRSIYSDDMPVGWDTDAIMIQDGNRIRAKLDIPCLNCGECVRTCPSNIQINMLVRFLENGLYNEAAQDHDLMSCVECGLCSYVCPAGIPVFHYMMLGKYEYGRQKSTEESNA